MGFSLLQDVPPACVSPRGTVLLLLQSPRAGEATLGSPHRPARLSPAGASSICFFTKKRKRKTEPLPRGRCW